MEMIFAERNANIMNDRRLELIKLVELGYEYEALMNICNGWQQYEVTISHWMYLLERFQMYHFRYGRFRFGKVIIFSDFSSHRVTFQLNPNRIGGEAVHDGVSQSRPGFVF